MKIFKILQVSIYFSTNFLILGRRREPPTYPYSLNFSPRFFGKISIKFENFLKTPQHFIKNFQIFLTFSLIFLHFLKIFEFKKLEIFAFSIVKKYPPPLHPGPHPAPHNPTREILYKLRILQRYLSCVYIL